MLLTVTANFGLYIEFSPWQFIVGNFFTLEAQKWDFDTTSNVTYTLL